MNQTALVLGGSGFVGRHMTEALLAKGWQVRVGVRNVAKARAQFYDKAGLEVIAAPIQDQSAVEAAVHGVGLVVNCVGILSEFGAQSFDVVQCHGAISLVKTAAMSGVETFVQISSLASDPMSESHYARTKGEAEVGILAAFPTALILRPSLVFGPGDGFFQRFAHMSRLSPFLPVIGDGQTKFQPIYVQDLAKALIAALEKPETRGKIYELGGPSIYTFRALIDYIIKIIPRRRFVMSLPIPLAKLMAISTAWMPGAPITKDQLRLLKFDTIVDEYALSLRDLGVEATPLETIVPSYIG